MSARSKWYLKHVCVCVSHSVMFNSLRPHGLQPTSLLCPWDFPGKDTGVGFQFLLQGILPTQGSNPGLLHCRQILFQLSYKGSPQTPRCSVISSTHNTLISQHADLVLWVPSTWALFISPLVIHEKKKIKGHLILQGMIEEEIWHLFI